jgi:hypothetical protein
VQRGEVYEYIPVIPRPGQSRLRLIISAAGINEADHPVVLGLRVLERVRDRSRAALRAISTWVISSGVTAPTCLPRRDFRTRSTVVTTAHPQLGEGLLGLPHGVHGVVRMGLMPAPQRGHSLPHSQLPQGHSRSPRQVTPAHAPATQWLIISAHTQLRLARHLTGDLRRPWEKPVTEPHRLTTARIRRGFQNLRAKTTLPVSAPKPSHPDQGAHPDPRTSSMLADTTSARTPPADPAELKQVQNQAQVT